MRRKGLRPLTSKQRAYFFARQAGMKALAAWVHVQQMAAFWGY